MCVHTLSVGIFHLAANKVRKRKHPKPLSPLCVACSTAHWLCSCTAAAGHGAFKQIPPAVMFSLTFLSIYTYIYFFLLLFSFHFDRRSRAWPSVSMPTPLVSLLLHIMLAARCLIFIITILAMNMPAAWQGAVGGGWEAIHYKSASPRTNYSHRLTHQVFAFDWSFPGCRLGPQLRRVNYRQGLGSVTIIIFFFIHPPKSWLASYTLIKMQ